MSERKGFSLLEVVVACALIGIVLSIVGPIIGPTGQVLQKVNADTGAQQTAVITLEKLCKEIGYSDSRGVTITTTPQEAFTFPSTDPPIWTTLTPLANTDVTTFGLYTTPVVWQKFGLVFYDSSAQKLYRKDLPYSGADLLAQVLSAKVSAYVSDTNYPALTLATNVTAFSFTAVNENLFSIDVTVTQMWNTARTAHFQTDISTRN